MVGDGAPPDTLGVRLDELGRRIAARTLLTYPWTGPALVLADHLAALPTLSGRFDRDEVDPVGRLDIAPRRPIAGIQYPAPADRVAERGRPLPTDVARRLRDVVGPAADTVRVHDDAAAGDIARAHRADAVTLGGDVYFAEGKYRPREPEGFALLAHEATHVEFARPATAVQRATSAGRRDEEHVAMSREHAAAQSPSTLSWHGRSSVADVVSLGGRGATPTTREGSSARGAAAVPTTSASSPAAYPMAAAADRILTAPPPGAGSGQTPQASTEIDVDALRKSVIDDLRRQLRREFERGA